MFFSTVSPTYRRDKLYVGIVTLHANLRKFGEQIGEIFCYLLNPLFPRLRTIQSRLFNNDIIIRCGCVVDLLCGLCSIGWAGKMYGNSIEF